MGAPSTIWALAPTLGAPVAWVPGADGICPQVAGEQKYHPECFSCLNCHTFIGDGDTYALVERSKLYWYVPAWVSGWGDTSLGTPHPPAASRPRSGHCYYQMVVTPVIEQILPDSPASRIPHTVTLVSIPASSDGKRGFSVSIDQGCGTEHPRTVRVRECVCHPLCHRPLPGAGGILRPFRWWDPPHRDFLGWEGEGWGWCVPIGWGWPEGTVVACPQPSGWLGGDTLALPHLPGWAVGTGLACPRMLGLACGYCASVSPSRRSNSWATCLRVPIW